MKKVQPLVSVIVPVYNVEEYLQECIDSILSQTYKNIEIILVDDGSTDGSGQMCDEFAKNNEQIKSIHKENSGPNETRKIGVDSCSGEYVTFVDSDDIVSKNLIDYLLETVVDYNSDIVICAHKEFIDVPDINSTELTVEVRPRKDVIKNFLTGVYIKGYLLETVHMRLYKKTILDKVNWQKTNYRVNEDELIMSYIYSSLSQDVIPFVKNELYYYRQRQGSIMADARKEYVNSFNHKKVERWGFLKVAKELRHELFGQEFREEISYGFSMHYLLYLLNQARSGGYRLSDKNRKLYDDSLQDIIRAHDKYPLWSLYIDMFECIKNRGSVVGALDYLKYAPTVSVVIPVWNGERYLRECIASVVKQTYKNTEIILINDGSTDRTGEICDEFAESDERVIVVHRENGGVSSARNLGIDMSNGEYLMFVDGDDFLRLDAVMTLVDSMDGARDDIVAANMTEYHTNGYSSQVASGYLVNERQRFKLKGISKHSIYDLLTRINSPFNKLYRLNFLRMNNMRFPEDLRIAEDFNFLTKALLEAKSIRYVNDWLYFYRQDFDNDYSATGNIDSSKALDFGKSLKDIRDYIIKGGHSDPKLDAAMRMTVVDHSLYALNITEKNMQLNKDVFRYLHDDLLGYFGISEKDCDHPPRAKRLAFILQGSYEGYLFNKMNELRSYSEEQTYALHDLRKQVAERDDEIGALRGRIDYMSSPIGMIRTPLGRAKRLAKKAAKKAIGRVRP